MAIFFSSLDLRSRANSMKIRVLNKPCRRPVQLVQWSRSRFSLFLVERAVLARVNIHGPTVRPFAENETTKTYYRQPKQTWVNETKLAQFRELEKGMIQSRCLILAIFP